MCVEKNPQKIHWYHSIFMKQIMLFMVLLFPGIFFCIQLYSSFSMEVQNITLELMRTSRALVFNDLDARISYKIQQQYVLYNNQDLKLLEIMWDDYQEEQRAQRIKSIQDTLSAYLISDDLAKEISVYIPSVGLKISNRTYGVCSPQDIENMQNYLDQNRPVVTDGKKLLCVSNSLSRSQELPKFIGVSSFSDAYFYRMLSQLNFEGGAFFALDDQYYIAKAVNTPEEKQLQDEIIDYYRHNHEAGDISQTITINGQKMIYYQLYSTTSDLCLVLYAPYSQAVIRMRTQLGILLIFFAVEIAVMVCTLLFTRFIFLRPVTDMMEGFKRLEGGESGVQLSYQKRDEFFALFQSFNRMSSKLQETIEQVYQQTIALQASELKQLQAQINPHFLYNSFFLLRGRIRRGDTQGAMDLADLLGQFFRFITYNETDFIPLADEWNNAFVYAQIQNNRFFDRFDMDFPSLPPALTGLHVPKLIIQPIIENAVKYAFECSEEKGLLRTGWKSDGDYLLLYVEDSGDFLSDDTLEQMNQMLHQRPEYDSSKQYKISALVNIHRRLCLFNREEKGLEVQRSELGGLKVTLIFNRNACEREGKNDTDISS